MSSRKLGSSRDVALSELDRKKEALVKSRLRVVSELERIDHSLKQIQAEYGKILNESSPLLNLPTEVTCMIFDLSVANCTLDKPEKPLLPNSLPPEVVISHVCTQWRDVSLNYPRLWATFFFRAEKVKTMRNSLDRFDEYIKRSGSENLELFFNFDKERYQYPPQPNRLKEQWDLLDMAIKQVERWKIVTVMAMNPRIDHRRIDLDVESRFLDLKFASVPNLEYFVYSPASPYDANAYLLWRSIDISNPGMFIGGAPKLRYLSFDCSTLTLPPFSNITTLRLEAIDTSNLIYTWETFLEILSIPSLANLSLVGHVCMNQGLAQLNNLDVIDMKNLKHLRYRDHRFMRLLLPYVRAPLLETLVISNDDGLLEEELGQNFAFGSSGCPYFFPSLETLTLIESFRKSNYNSVQCMVNLTQNIKSIIISDGTASVDFIGFLLQFGDDWWPMLASITVNALWNRNQVTSMLDLVRSPPMDACLKLRLFIETNFDWKTHHKNAYREMQEHCTIEVFKAEEQAKTVLMRPRWPPGVDCPDYPFIRDPFQVQIASRIYR